MQRLALRLDPKMVFLSQKTLSKEILLAMVTRYLNLRVQLLPNFTPTTTITFDLWMSRGQHDTFAFVVNFLSSYWKSHHVTIGLFEANDITGQELAKQLKAMLEKFGPISKVLCYVKNEGTNLASMITTLTYVISCEALSLLVPFDGACFGHVMSKTTQYTTNDDKISKDLVYKIEAYMLRIWFVRMQTNNSSENAFCIQGCYVSAMLGL
jgi:hypothetical protein